MSGSGILYWRALAGLVFTACVIASSTSAATAPQAPFPLFSFAAPEPPQVTQPPSSDEAEAPFELPARFKRQVVNYPTREAAGTIIIDTLNT